jgi:hypothetical protein
MTEGQERARERHVPLEDLDNSSQEIRGPALSTFANCALPSLIGAVESSRAGSLGLVLGRGMGLKALL